MKVSKEALLQSRLFQNFARNFASLLAFASLLLASTLVTGCNLQATTNSSQPSAAKNAGTSSKPVTDVTKAQIETEEVYLKAIEEVALAADSTNEDGWIAGSHSRVFKSGYGAVNPATKAQFAVAYQKMLDKSGQNLATDIKTYVPYSTREQFARQWWMKSDCAKQFQAEQVKKQIAWCYESVLDASELFWRVFEMRHPGQANSAAVLAHDKEQEMVFDYREDEQTPGSFSNRYEAWKQKKPVAGGAAQQK